MTATVSLLLRLDSLHNLLLLGLILTGLTHLGVVSFSCKPLTRQHAQEILQGWILLWLFFCAFCLAKLDHDLGELVQTATLEASKYIGPIASDELLLHLEAIIKQHRRLELEGRVIIVFLLIQLKIAYELGAACTLRQLLSRKALLISQ